MTDALLVLRALFAGHRVHMQREYEWNDNGLHYLAGDDRIASEQTFTEFVRRAADVDDEELLRLAELLILPQLRGGPAVTTEVWCTS